ncbi:hypothetical protein BDZ97DRAFT_1988702, partial [Flammula alnicola]
DDISSKLQAIFPERLVLAALDIIDHGNATHITVIHYTTPWGHSEYEVLGSTAKYAVLLDLRTAKIPYSCACPAFVYSVLMSNTHIMCKHILAAMIARKMNLCIKRPSTADDLVAIYSHQFPPGEQDPADPG